MSVHCLLPAVIILVTTVVIPPLPVRAADGQCSQDIRSGYRLLKVDSPASYIGNPIQNIDAEECFFRCCEKSSTEGCNTASMFRYNGVMYCLLVKCQPLASCKWSKAGADPDAKAALITPRLDWGAVTESSIININTTVNATEAPVEVTTHINATHNASAVNHTVEMTTVAIEETTADSGVTRDPFSSLGIQQPLIPVGGVVAPSSPENSVPPPNNPPLKPLSPLGSLANPVAPVNPLAPAAPVAPAGQVPALTTAANPVVANGLLPAGSINVAQPVTDKPTTTKSNDKDPWGWLWNWGGDESTAQPTVAPIGITQDATTQQNTAQGLANQPATNTATGVAGNTGTVGATNIATGNTGTVGGVTGTVGGVEGTLPKATIDAQHIPAAPINSASIPVYDGFGNPIKATTAKPESNEDSWMNWWGGNTETKTASPFDSDLGEGEDDGWDDWIQEQKEENGWYDNNSKGGVATTEFTPGLEDLGHYPSVHESGRKFISSDAHRPLTGSSFLDSSKKMIAARNASRPIIIAGLCSLIAMVMLIMFFMARKTCQEKDRSRYRPLRDDSFSEIAYHDHPSSMS